MDVLCFFNRAVGVTARPAITAILTRRPHRPPHAVEAVVARSTSSALRSRCTVDAGVSARSIAAGGARRSLHPRSAVTA